MVGLQIQPHDASITQWDFLFYHYNLQGSCLRTVIQPLVETAGLLISWAFPFLPRTIPTSTDQQGGVSFQTTPMGKVTHTHSPRTGVESSTTYLRVRIRVYSPRTGIRSKCLQNPCGVTLTMVTTCDAFKMQWVFPFLPRPTDEYLRVLQQ